MRIVHIISGLTVGGAERSLFNLLSCESCDNHEIIVISLTKPGFYSSLISEMGIRVYSLNLKFNLFLFWRLINFLKIVRNFDPDIIQGWMYHGNILSTLSSFFVPRKIPVFWNIRQSLGGYKYLALRLRFLIAISLYFSKFPTKIIYNGRAAREQHEAIGFPIASGITIPNGYDIDFWRPSLSNMKIFRGLHNISSGQLVLGFVARYDIQKDLPNFLIALRGVFALMPQLKVVFVGRGLGLDNPELMPHFQHLPIQNIIFAGECENVLEYMQCFDYLCLSSLSESFPNVVGEAMAVGVPCIVTDVGDCMDIVGKTGWVVPPRRSDLLEEAIKLALSEGEASRLERGRLSRQRISRDYSLNKVAFSYNRLYSMLD